VKAVIGCAEPYYYRNKMEFTFANSRWLTDEEMRADPPIPQQVALGLHVPQRYDKVVDLQECWLQSETSAAIVNTLREVARGWDLTVYSTETQEGYLRHLVIKEAKHTGEMMVNLVTSRHWPDAMERLAKLLLEHFPNITTIVNNVTARRSMVAVGEEERIYHGPGYITEKLGDRTFRISANSFFQTNTLQAERLYAVAREMAALRSDDVVYDLYSGTGTIAIFVADAVERVVGIEVVESAIADAQRNAEVNNVSNCYFIKGDLKDRVTRDRDWMRDHPKPSVVIADPPRNGMHEKVVREIVGWRPSRVVYVSCNPSTQARDAKIFLEGGYVLAGVQPVDMFPHTDHIESVALFTLPS
jgi:23S rRNA (uracil1939-C5)-methyltransferase